MNLHRTFAAGAFVALLLACDINSDPDDPSYERRDDLTQAVVSCEEAYARLETCCPGFDADTSGFDRRRALCLDFQWLDAHKGCDGQWYRDDKGAIEPLALSESTCIRERSCERLVESGVCDRAQADLRTPPERGVSRPAHRGICS